MMDLLTLATAMRPRQSYPVPSPSQFQASYSAFARSRTITGEHRHSVLCVTAP